MNSKFVIFLFAVSCACATVVFGFPATHEDPADDQPIQSLRASCVLPMEIGICRARMPRWGYDANAKDCVSFFYGGCMGNANNFLTKEDCVKACTGV